MNPPENFIMLATYGYWLALIIVHIALAVAVFRDTEVLWQAQKLWLLNGFLWMLATLVGGIVTVGIYWAIHHSTLRSPSATENISSETSTDIKS